MQERAWRKLGQCIISGEDNSGLITTLNILQIKIPCRRVWGSVLGRGVQLRQNTRSAEADTAGLQDLGEDHGGVNPARVSLCLGTRCRAHPQNLAWPPGALSSARLEFQPQSRSKVQTGPTTVDTARLAHSPSLICQKALRKEKDLIVEMEAETSLRFQSNELGPHPVAN